MSNRQLEEFNDERHHANVAKSLGITVKDLDPHPYTLEENTSNDGLVYGVRVLWEGTAPKNVTTYGTIGSLWSDLK